MRRRSGCIRHWRLGGTRPDKRRISAKHLYSFLGPFINSRGSTSIEYLVFNCPSRSRPSLAARHGHTPILLRSPDVSAGRARSSSRRTHLARRFRASMRGLGGGLSGKGGISGKGGRGVHGHEKIRTREATAEEACTAAGASLPRACAWRARRPCCPLSSTCIASIEDIVSRGRARRPCCPGQAQQGRGGDTQVEKL